MVAHRLWFLAIALALLAAVPAAHARRAAGGNSIVGVITFDSQSASYTYPAAPGSLVGNLVASTSAGPFAPAGSFTLSSDPGCSDLSISFYAVEVGASNLTGSGTCTITANYPGLVPVSALFSWNGTQQTITSIAPASYAFVAPAGGSGAILGTPSVTMSGGISFAAGGGTLALATGAQCSSLTYSSPTLKTIPSLTAGTYGCSLIATDANASNSGFSQSISVVGSGATIVALNLSDPNFQASTPNAPVGTLSCTLSSGLTCSGTYSIISSGSDHSSTACNASSGADFAASGTTLQTNPTGLAAATYSDICVQVAVSGVTSPLVQAFDLVGTASTLVGTKTFYNNGSSTTPGSVFPVHWEQEFAPGDVPSGSIAVPTVGGSAIQYGVDCAFEGCPTWPDGSLKAINVSAFLPQLTSNALETVQFTAQAGTYPTTSTATPASLAASASEKTVLSDVNNSWIPEFYGFWLTPRIQIGCHVSGGSVTDCPIRVNIPAASSYGYTCTTAAPLPSFTGRIDNGTPGVAGTTLTVTAVTPGQGNLSGGRIGASSGASGFVPALTPLVLKDATSAIAPGTILVKQLSGTQWSVGTYQVNVSQSVPSETITGAGCSGAVYRGALTSSAGNINNVFDVNAAVFSTVLDGRNFPSSTTVISGGSGYSLIGSGSMTFDPNVILSQYGTNQPPSCAAELGAGVFSANYSAGALTTTSVTSGHIATGQIVTDSLGATAVVTGTASPWAVSGALASGAMTANTPACVYAKSPTMYGVRVFGYYLDGTTPDSWHQMTQYVEMWSLAGTPFSVRTTARSAMPFRPGAYFPSDTYDIDLKVGTAEIRGAANGDTIYSALTDEAAAAWYTLDTCPPSSNPVGCSAKADWIGVTPNNATFYAANSRAFNSVVPTLLTTDKPYWRLARVMLPLDDTQIPSPLVVPLNGLWDTPLNSQGYYQPLGSTWVDSGSGWGSGGNHFFLAAHGNHLPYWYLVTDRASDYGASWLQQMRVAALGPAGTSAGFYEGDTLHPLNVDPTFSNAAFTDPVRTNSGFQGNFAVGAANMGQYGGQNNDVAEVGQTSHWPSGTIYGAFAVDGERWQLDEMDLNASNALTNYSDGGQRIITFGGNTYYGVVTNDFVPRTEAWAMQLIDQAANWGMPNEPDTKYWRQIQATNYTQKTAFVAYTGTFSFGSPIAGSGTKLYDWSTNGAPEGGSNVISLQNGGPSHQPPFNISEPPWMDTYWSQAVLLDQMWENHSIAALDTFSREMNYNYIVTMAATDPCPYNQSQYAAILGATSDGLPNADHNSTALSGGHGNIFRGTDGALSATSGNQVITTTLTTADTPASVVGTTIPSGSTVWPTTFNANNNVNGLAIIPPYDDHTHYTWCSLSPTTGTINPFGTSCGSPAPITPTGTGRFNAGWILNQACPAVNNTNGAWSSLSGQGVGYLGHFWPVMNWWVAVNGSDANSTAAINAYAPLETTLPGFLITYPGWAASSSFAY